MPGVCSGILPGILPDVLQTTHTYIYIFDILYLPCFLTGFIWHSIWHYIWHLSDIYYPDVQRAGELAKRPWCPVSAVWRITWQMGKKVKYVQNSSGHALKHFRHREEEKSEGSYTTHTKQRLNLDTTQAKRRHNLDTTQTQPRHNPDTPAKSETQPRHNPDTPAKSETQPRHNQDAPAKRETQPRHNRDSSAKSETQPRCKQLKVKKPDVRKIVGLFNTLRQATAPVPCFVACVARELETSCWAPLLPSECA